MRNSLVGIVLFVLVGFAQGQTIPTNDLLPTLRLNKQVACEKKLLRDSGAEEIVNGPEYEIFLYVAAAFKRANPPRLYFVPGGGNSVYVAGSVVADGRGKILMSRIFVRLMGNTPALKGIMAHEMAHLVADVHGATSCDQWVVRDPEAEEAADALAAHTVGFGPVRAFLLRVKEFTGAKDSEATSRLQALEKLEAQENRQR
jgi:hypothetical protein